MKTIDGMAKVESEMTKGLEQMNVVFKSLDALTADPKGNLKMAYGNYSKELNRLDAMAKKVAARNQTLKARSDAYFQNWQKETANIKGQDIRSISEQRQAAARACFDRMTTTLAQGKAAFVAMMDELRDIELYLANDLTAAGIKTCEPLVTAAIQDSQNVKSALNEALQELIRLKHEFSPGTKSAK